MPVPSHLIAAYRAAHYEVDAGRDQIISFNVDVSCAALDDFLRREAVRYAVVLTAHNPGSEKRTAAENAAAHQALADEVGRIGKITFPSRGCDPDKEWPAEPGLLVLDLSRTDALRLAHRFGQFAFVWIELGHAPELVLAQ